MRSINAQDAAALRRATACRGGGVLAATRGGRLLKHLPSTPGSLLVIGWTMCGSDWSQIAGQRLTGWIVSIMQAQGGSRGRAAPTLKGGQRERDATHRRCSARRWEPMQRENLQLLRHGQQDRVLRLCRASMAPAAQTGRRPASGSGPRAPMAPAPVRAHVHLCFNTDLSGVNKASIHA